MKLTRQHHIKPTIPMSTMADLAMLLLIFFVICGKIAARSNVPVSPPRSITAVAIPSGDAIILSVTPDGMLHLNGRMLEETSLRDELSGLLSQRTGRQDRTVYIETDRDTPYRAYVTAVEIVNQAKGYVELKVLR